MKAIKKWMALAVAAALIAVVLPAQTKRIRPASGHFFVKCGMIIDPLGGNHFKNALMEVNSGKILRIGLDGDLAVPEGAKILDFSDKYIIPGLIDTHGHLFGGLSMRYTTCDLLAGFYLAAGVTSVRSPGGMEPEGDMALRDRINSGRYIGPRYFNSGPYVEADPVTVGWMNPVRTEEEVRLKIDQWIQKGATSVKIYAAMGGDLLRTAIEHGHAHGVKVVGHIGAVFYKEVMQMGIDELFHGILAMPDIMPEEIADYKEHYKILGEIDLSQHDIEGIVQMAAEMKVVLTPTADVVEPIDPVKNHMEEQKKYYTAAALKALEKRLAKPFIPNPERVMENNKKFIRMAYDAGCILTTGTDQVGFTLLPGYSLWREMEIFAEAGLPPIEVLKAATFNGAYALGWSDLLGTIEPGKLADFVVLNANPLDDISNCRNVHRVVKGGVLYDPAKILKSLEGRVH